MGVTKEGRNGEEEKKKEIEVLDVKEGLCVFPPLA